MSDLNLKLDDLPLLSELEQEPTHLLKKTASGWTLVEVDVDFWSSDAPGTDNLILGSKVNNTIDSVATKSVITAPGSTPFPNHIGKLNGLPAGTDETPTGWSADSGYVPGGADVAAILGGYDHICNAIGSAIVGGGHNIIKYNNVGHGNILGGSYNVLDAGRGTIVGGKGNSLTGGGSLNVFSWIGGGDQNDIINALYGNILGGQNNTITDADRTVILGGDDNVISAGADFSLLFGDTNTSAHVMAHVLGGGGVAPGRNTITLAAPALQEVGDRQSFWATCGARTTNATATNLTGFGSQGLLLDATKRSAGLVRVFVIGMRDGSADGNNDADYTTVAYEGTFGYWWDGTNGHFYDAAGESSVAASPTRNLTLISQTNNDFTAGAAPTIRINTGFLRLQVTGIAATIINWTGFIIGPMTIVS